MSNQGDIMDAIVNVIDGLSLLDPDGVTSAVCAKSYFPEVDDDQKTKLRIYVAPGDISAEPLGGGIDTINYIIDIIMVRTIDDITSATEFESLVMSKRAIQKALLNQHLTAVDGGPYCETIQQTPTFEYERMKARNQFLSVTSCVYIAQELQ